MNLIVGQSGGPTSVINSSLAGVIVAGIEEGFDKIFVSLHGIEGLIDGEIREVDKEKFIDDNIKEKLMARPSSILKSCRYKMPDDLNDEVYQKVFDRLRENEITSFIYIGGNDSMDTVMKLNKYMKKEGIDDIHVIGCPKTIDNDLEVMDHSPGFGSAAKFIGQTLRTIRTDVDIYNLQSVTFVEIMGRHAGWLAASSLVANHKMEKEVVNLVYLPEDDLSIDEIIDQIKEKLKEEDNIVIGLAEGFMDRDKKLEEEIVSHSSDGFDHKIVEGVGQRLSDIIKDELQIKSRAVELNIVQRTNTLISKTDAEEAFELGKKATILSKEKTNLIPVLVREEGLDYKVSYTETSPDKIANHEALIPSEWLDNREILTEKITAYTLPIIQGEIEATYEDGLPVFVSLKDFLK